MDIEEFLISSLDLLKIFDVDWSTFDFAQSLRIKGAVSKVS